MTTGIGGHPTSFQDKVAAVGAFVNNFDKVDADTRAVIRGRDVSDARHETAHNAHIGGHLHGRRCGVADQDNLDESRSLTALISGDPATSQVIVVGTRAVGANLREADVGGLLAEIDSADVGRRQDAVAFVSHQFRWWVDKCGRLSYHGFNGLGLCLGVATFISEDERNVGREGLGTRARVGDTRDSQIQRGRARVRSIGWYNDWRCAIIDGDNRRKGRHNGRSIIDIVNLLNASGGQTALIGGDPKTNFKEIARASAVDEEIRDDDIQWIAARVLSSDIGYRDGDVARRSLVGGHTEQGRWDGVHTLNDLHKGSGVTTQVSDSQTASQCVDERARCRDCDWGQQLSHSLAVVEHIEHREIGVASADDRGVNQRRSELYSGSLSILHHSKFSHGSHIAAHITSSVFNAQREASADTRGNGGHVGNGNRTLAVVVGSGRHNSAQDTVEGVVLSGTAEDRSLSVHNVHQLRECGMIAASIGSDPCTCKVK